MLKTFPSIYSTLSPDVLSTELLPKFEIGKISECVFYSGGFNDTYLVKTVDGRTFYLRAYRRPWRKLDDIQYELDVLNYLKRKNFPAARPVVYKNGEFYCEVLAPEGVRYLALFTEAPGKEISYEVEPEKMAQRYGQAVAEMHNALNGFNSQHQRFHKDLEHFVDMPIKNVAPYLKHRPEDWYYFQRFAKGYVVKSRTYPLMRLNRDSATAICKAITPILISIKR